MSTQSQPEPHVIRLLDGDTLVPRPDFAAELHVNPKTVERMKLPTTYIGGKAYIKRNASLKIIADKVRRPSTNDTPKKKGARR